MPTKSMASVKLSGTDKKDLDKFTKFLALKAAQIIVQSRLGERVHTQCKPHSSGTDWFNLAIRDVPEVLIEAKKAMCNEIVSARVPLCVEISLRTVEGDTMVLESWSLGVLPEQCDPTVRITYTVYNKMGLLLKSLLSVTRVTPAYKLSRRQSPDSYHICYRIYMGEPQTQNLGEGYKQVRVGQLCTPVGTIHLSVSYRTKMTISPQSNDRDNSIMLKSDHFRPDFTPKTCSQQSNNEELNTSMSETIKFGAFADKTSGELDESMIIPDAPFSSLLTPRQHSPPKSSTLTQTRNNNNNSSCTGSDGENEVLDGNGNTTPRLPSRPDSRRSSCSLASNAADDFIMIDLKTPFANMNVNNDLGAFYSECQSAPPLQTFNDEPTLADAVCDLTKQIEDFELSVPRYEHLLSTLCNVDNNN